MAESSRHRVAKDTETMPPTIPTASATVPRPPQEVYDFLAVLANHEAFCDHYLIDWSTSGPRSGVGSKIRVRANLPGPKDWNETEIIEAKAPRRIVERGVSAKGKRRTRGTFTLEPAPGDATLVRFDLVFEAQPAADRLVNPFLRGYLAKGNQKAMDRLAALMTAPAPAAA
jgi:uncharacterized protein YndB with AHSA1/START domain